ncbi:unnamed protein product, partial [marine sediment metagenome]
PYMQELIEITKDKIGLNCEIKARGIAEKIIKILNESDIINTTIISSFKRKRRKICSITRYR